MMTIFSVIFVIFGATFFGLVAALCAAKGIKETRGEEAGTGLYVGFGFIGALVGILLSIGLNSSGTGMGTANMIIFIIFLAILTILQAANHQGGHRFASWFWLTILVDVSLAFTLVDVAAKKEGLSLGYLFLLIPALAPFVAGIIRAAVGTSIEKKEKEETDNRKFVTNVLLATLLIVVLIMLIGMIVMLARNI